MPRKLPISPHLVICAVSHTLDNSKAKGADRAGTPVSHRGNLASQGVLFVYAQNPSTGKRKKAKTRFPVRFGSAWPDAGKPCFHGTIGGPEKLDVNFFLPNQTDLIV